jgi:hypothetical protein
VAGNRINISCTGLQYHRSAQAMRRSRRHRIDSPDRS